MTTRRRRQLAPFTVAVTPATPGITHPNTQQMTATVTNVHGGSVTGANASGRWSSTNELVATVDQAGLVTSVNNAKATGVLSSPLGVNFADTETVTIGSKTYTMQATLVNANGNVQLGATTEASLVNLQHAINLTGTPGTHYAAAMTLHPTVTATTRLVAALTLEAKTGGTGGNAIATTETAGNWVFGAATLTGGVSTCQIVFTSHNKIVDATPAVLTVS